MCGIKISFAQAKQNTYYDIPKSMKLLILFREILQIQNTIIIMDRIMSGDKCLLRKTPAIKGV